MSSLAASCCVSQCSSTSTKSEQGGTSPKDPAGTAAPCLSPWGPGGGTGTNSWVPWACWCSQWRCLARSCRVSFQKRCARGATNTSGCQHRSSWAQRHWWQDSRNGPPELSFPGSLRATSS
uniref:Uncharacterized protein n=1 Tax=Ixodes ricinus TaxID=34613 RepID=A0A6B0UNC5_IXORI